MSKSSRRPSIHRAALSKAQISGTTVLMLRTCNAKRQGYGGFQWPETGYVEAPDWKPNSACGNGLHGLLRGEGSTEYLNLRADAVWQVVEVDASTVVDISSKVKAPAGNVLYSGNREMAVAMIHAKHVGSAVVFCTATAGYGGTATAGDCGTATAGYGGTATAGERGTATAGYGGTATAGDCGTATAGDCGTATAGYGGTATAGDCGTATAGECGEIRIRWYDGKRYRTEIGYIGESGLLAKTGYRLNADHKFVKA